MTYRNRILARLTGQDDDRPLFLPDLTLWHKWHQQRSTLPPGFGPHLADAARGLGAPIWLPFKAWQTQYTGARWMTQESDTERVVRFETEQGVLTARWTLGPEGDWWQTEYPVKTAEDLAIALTVVRGRVYVLDDYGLDEARRMVGEDGVVALELPMRPYSDVLHTLLGWGEGLVLLASERSLAEEIMGVLEEKLDAVTQALIALPGDVFLAPDNLDGQYISPRVFRASLAPSYTRTVEIARRCARPLVVHVGGPAKRLVPLLAEAGVACVEGVSGPPQSDITLTEARAAAGPNVTLWGGLPQDYLTSEWDDAAFEAALQNALAEVRADGRGILGVADRVPVNAEVSRLARCMAAAEGA